MRAKRLLIGLLLRLGFTLTLLGVLAVVPLPTAHATTVTVTNTDDDGSGSLREAIASAAPGDTIAFSLTYPATITLTSGELTIAKNLTIDGPGADQLAISGDDASRVFHISSGEVTLNDLKVTQGTAASYVSGGGIYIVNSSTAVTLTQVSIVDNSAGDGGGIYLESGSLVVEGGQVISNTATASGGGIYLNSGKAVLNGGEIRNNTAEYGGGVCIIQDNATFIQTGSSIIAYNVAGANGGGLLIWQGSATLSGGEIRGNTASLWGGGVIVGYGTSTFTQTGVSTITHNTAVYGGGVYVHQSNAVFDGGQVLENNADHGGGVYIAEDTATALFSGGQILSNTAAYDGGGIYVYSGTATLSGGQIARNTAQYGGGLLIYGGSATLSDGEIHDNVASDLGGGVMVGYENATFTQTGTSVITHNSAQSGGGIYIHRGSATLDSGQIANNTASDGSTLYNHHGAITQTHALTISGHIYQENGTFSGGSDPLVVQGALSLMGGTFTAPSGGLQLDITLAHFGGTYRQTQNVTGTADVGFPRDGGVIINANDHDLGNTEVVIQAGVDCTATAGETVKHCYNITPTNTPNVSATITFYFNAGELSGNTCDILNVYHWNGSSWSALTLDTTYDSDGRDCNSTPRSVRVKDVSAFSPFVLKSGGPPTVVTLASFTATAQKGNILIAWETAIEIDNVGFNLYCSTSPNGPYVKLNEALIPSQSPGSIFGAVYTWLDEDVEVGTTYYYKLEDIEIGGRRTFHGPIAAQPTEPTALMLRSLGTRSTLASALPALLGAWGLVVVWWIQKHR
jgi:hypothetical protein